MAAAKIELEALEKLCSLHCTQPDIAAFFGCTLNAVEKRVISKTTYDYNGQKLTFREIMELGYGKGRVSLRRRQFELADRGNPTMLIWLGKQILGQRDHQEIEHLAPGGQPLLTFDQMRSFMQSTDE